jgi:hypothetical protein
MDNSGHQCSDQAFAFPVPLIFQLNAQEYPCVIVLLFDNIWYNDSLSMFGGIAQYLKNKAEKKLDRLVCSHRRNEDARLFEFRRTIQELLDATSTELGLSPATGFRGCSSS